MATNTAGVAATFSIVDHLSPAAQKTAAKIKDWRPIWPAILAAMWKGEAKIFAAQGPGWKPLSERTKNARRKGPKERRPKILRDSGHLYASITGPGIDSIHSEAPLRLTFGSRRRYAAAMQFGLPKRGPVTQHVKAFMRRKPHGKKRTVAVRAHTREAMLPAVPARPFLKFTPFMIHAIERIACDWMEELWNEGGGRG